MWGRRIRARGQRGYRAPPGGTVSPASSPAAAGRPHHAVWWTDTQRYTQLFSPCARPRTPCGAPPACVWGEQTHTPRDPERIPPCSVSRKLNTKQMVAGTDNLHKWSLS